MVLAPGAISPRQTAHFDYGSTTPGVVSLDIVGLLPFNLTWVGGTHGTVSNTWNQNSTTNTAWSGGNYFAVGDNVTFDATSANTTVTVSGAVQPLVADRDRRQTLTLSRGRARFTAARRSSCKAPLR